MPPQQRDPTMEGNQRPIRRILSGSELSVGSTTSLGSEVGTPRNASEYRVRKSKLIG